MCEHTHRGMARIISGMQIALFTLISVVALGLIGAAVPLFPDTLSYILGGTGMGMLMMMLFTWLLVIFR